MVPARKIRSDCLRFLPAPLGAWVGKILILLRFTDAPGFAEPTPPVRILTGGPRASPTQFRKVFLRTAGEGLKVNRPKAERSLPGMCPSRGPASVQPLRKQRGRNQIRRRGGPCGRLYSRCESWRAHAMRPYWFPVDCRGGYQPPEPFPPWGKDDSPYQGEMSRRDKRGRGARRSRDG